MNSSEPIAASRRALLGAERAGLPATVTSARTCPSPGTSISSASVATGSWPNTSGHPRTRLFQRPTKKPGPPGRACLRRWAASGNMAPPGRSRLPVTTLRTSTSQLVTVPNSTVQVPIRP